MSILSELTALFETLNVRWNSMDVNFVDRWKIFQNYVNGELKEKIKNVQSQLELDKDTGSETYQVGAISDLGKDLCKKLNEVFDYDISSVAFQGVNPLSPSVKGNLLFADLINAITPIIQKSIKNFEDARKKYTNRAQRRAGAKSSKPNADETPNESGGGDAQ